MKLLSRIKYYDNLKFILMFLVVFGHFAGVGTDNSHLYRSIFIFLYSFHMPLFIFISGLFYKDKNIKQKIISYIAIGYILKIIMFVMGHFASGTYKFRLLSDSDIPWFLFVLAIYYGLSYLLKNIDKKYILIFFVLLALFIGYDKSIVDYLYLSRTIVFYPFFVLGQIIGKEKFIEIASNKKVRNIGIVILIMAALICFEFTDFVYRFRPLFTGRNPYYTLHSYSKYGFILRGFCYLVSIVMGLSFASIISNKETKITKYGSKTMQIYFWHVPFLLFLNAVGLEALLCYNKIGKIVWLLLSILLTWILTFDIFKYPTEKIINICNGKK